MRRVWIEILDRETSSSPLASPSMRRVWIEILCHVAHSLNTLVTLHAEGVD